MNEKLTPKEKAEELVGKFAPIFINANASVWTGPAIISASILCDEIITLTPMYIGELNPVYAYWKAVKKELDSL